MAIASCFVRAHPSSSESEETFHPPYAWCFVQAFDGWRAWRRTPALLIHHLIITKGQADCDDLLHPLARRCQTPSFSTDDSVTPALPPQNKPSSVKDWKTAACPSKTYKYATTDTALSVTALSWEPHCSAASMATKKYLEISFYIVSESIKT